MAAALLRAGVTIFTRSIKYHRPRGPFCLGGSCGQCLMRVDGVPSLPACRVLARAGSSCQRQNAPLGSVEADVLRAADFLFPAGLDHHHLFTSSRALGRVALELARRLGGLGELPDRELPPIPGRAREVEVAVVGAGPAGLAAAAEQGADAVVIEREAAPGGASLFGIDPGCAEPSWVEQTARALGDRLWLRSEAVGLYVDATPLLAVQGPQGLTALRARRVVVATGGVSQPLAFPGVDRPGVYAARGLVKLARDHGVRVGASLVVVGEGEELIHCSRALVREGYRLEALVDAGDEPCPAPADLPWRRARPLRAKGNPVRRLVLDDGARIDCDAVAIALPPAPLHELASGAGARTRFQQGGFAVEADERGRTDVPWLFAAGRVAGRGGGQARDSGVAAGREAAHG